MPKRVDPTISEDQIEELRRRKAENSGGFLRLFDLTAVFGEKFPISLVLARNLLPDDLHRELFQMISTQEVFFARIEDLLADFLDAVAASLPKGPPPSLADQIWREMAEKGYILLPKDPPARAIPDPVVAALRSKDEVIAVNGEPV